MNANRIHIKNFPILETKRFDLIEINDSHLENIFELYSDQRVTKYFDLIPLKNKSEAQREVDFYRKRFMDNIGIRWGIAFKNKTEIIGTLGYNKVIKDHKGRIGYDLQYNYWGKGIMSEALEAIVNYGFDKLELNRIEAEVMQDNIGSEKLLTKLQFQKEGILKNWMYWNNDFYDITMFSLIKSDYQKAKNSF
ncbi:GNAT family N-acetyltransferase [Pontimicrobium sp. IMCC45349]|uniref:GNAT family N-acetyltransferase n=1 Tax=Pontimicrobium sp. IMCC45349 TaxID=3391574 RepID=UPI0039A0C189